MFSDRDRSSLLGRLQTERRFVNGIWATAREDLFLTQFDRCDTMSVANVLRMPMLQNVNECNVGARVSKL